MNLKAWVPINSPTLTSPALHLPSFLLSLMKSRNKARFHPALSGSPHHRSGSIGIFLSNHFWKSSRAEGRCGTEGPAVCVCVATGIFSPPFDTCLETHEPPSQVLAGTLVTEEPVLPLLCQHAASDYIISESRSLFWPSFPSELNGHGRLERCGWLLKKSPPYFGFGFFI